MITENDTRMQVLKESMEKAKKKLHPESSLIGILHKAQELYGYLSRDVLDEIAHCMNIPTAHIWGVVTFYHYFNLTPTGKYRVSICLGTACYVKGAAAVLDAIKDELGISMGETTSDGLFTLQEARCLGACGLAPVVMVNDRIHGELTPQSVKVLLREYRSTAVSQSGKAEQ